MIDWLKEGIEYVENSSLHIRNETGVRTCVEICLYCLVDTTTPYSRFVGTLLNDK